jgi:hypothetical protein
MLRKNAKNIGATGEEKDRQFLFRSSVSNRIATKKRANAFDRRVELLRGRGEKTTNRLSSLVAKMNAQV